MLFSCTSTTLGYDNVSHGCISLSPEDAEWYFNTVNVGDPATIRCAREP
jgi:lipoprotein-anchoring transpeptidase ErfK/SrfK